MKKIFTILLIITASLAAAQKPEPARYGVVKLQGMVNPIMGEFIVDSIKKAGEEKLAFMVIQLDTPGGLMEPMRDIIKAIMTSTVPVIVYTYPKGAQAASAGGFIMLSAHIAAMAPGTEIGAMHPVSPMLDFMQKDEKGDPDGVMEKKVLNDTVAYAKSLAEKRGRNTTWTVNAVKKAISSTYSEALKLGVIDIVAEDMDDLVRQIDRRTVNINGANVTVSSSGKAPHEYLMDWKQKLLNHLADPQIVFILFILAVAGIGMEFKNPGMIVPGVLGAISLFLFLMAVRIIPINIMGLILIILGITLFILELTVTSYGLLTIGGIIAFVIGSMILVDSPLPGGGIPLSTIGGSILFILGFVFIVIRAVLNAHRARVTTGSDGMIGEAGRAIIDFSKDGKVMVHGEIWNAASDEEIKKGDRITVTGMSGMSLQVKKLPD
ncbi:MAG TPA: nodulation protein NfeD [Spirochaetota bacterium]|nr:nodulation protein NfeD [Spirochaetota bacterium]HRZ27641.1 nodulation protein NfeD [Spirochaetota bacterium]HSA16451.1 nodulation protein NfeD [Spirochaetota bacterium]